MHQIGAGNFVAIEQTGELELCADAVGRRDEDRVGAGRGEETAELADHHLAVRPGADAFLYAAMLAVLVEEDRVDHQFLAEHTTGAEEVLTELKRVPISDFCRPSSGGFSVA